jgi:hypothetical protein
VEKYKGGKIMKVENGILNIKISEFIEILNDNLDVSSSNYRINGILISIVKNNENSLTEKQRNWIIDKINYIIRSNKKKNNNKYSIPKINDVFFIVDKSEDINYTNINFTNT